MKTDTLGKLIHLKKLCTDNHHFQMLAVDQRPPILDTFFLILLVGTYDFFFGIFLGKKNPISCPWPTMMAGVGWRWQ